MKPFQRCGRQLANTCRPKSGALCKRHLPKCIRGTPNSRPQPSGRFDTSQARARVAAAYSAAAADPDAYLHSYDSDDDDGVGPAESSNSLTHIEDGSQGLKELPENASFPARIQYGILVAVHTIVTAPKETWRAVRITAGAAAALITNTAERGVQDTADEQQADESLGESQRTPVRRAKERWREARSDMPEGMWGKIQWIWDQPPVKKLRITISMAQWSVRLPAIMALLATQIGLLASQVSLPMLAPLLLGTGMMLRSIRSNASIIFPRICVLVVLLYVLWFANSVVQSTVVYLRRQGAVDARVSGAVITASECCALLAALVIVLSMIGVNVSGLLLPAGLALAYAAKDLSHNFLAGFFLFAVQPFKLGDRILVSYSTPAAASAMNRSAWFEGICEKVDLRYTIVKNGPRRLFVPNSAFLTREFVVVDDSDSPKSPSKRDLFPVEEAPAAFTQQQVQPPYGPVATSQRPVWAQSPQHYTWSRPPYQADGGAATLSATDGQSLQPPAQHWDGATPGSSSQSEDGRPRPSNSDCDEASAAERQGGRLHSNSNVLEWQRRHSSVQKTEAGHKGMEQQR